MRHVTTEDLQRTRSVLGELAARQDRLGAELDSLRIEGFVARSEWLIAHRTREEQLVWDRRWKRLPPPRPVRIPRAQQPRLSASEVLTELEWLRDNGANGWEAAAALNRKPSALSKLAYRCGRPDLAVYVDRSAA